MPFEVVVDDTFLNININPELEPVDNKHVVSLVNDFEEGKWRYSKFQNYVWDNIAETALSYFERDSLVNQSHSLLVAAAQNLRLTDKGIDIGKGSELAEIVLYGIMKNHYSALPVVPKIFYKQNAQDNAKGADSVHIVIDDNNDFTIWFGEAKFYKSIEDSRLKSIIQSVGNSLDSAKLKKENSIVTNVNDLDCFDLDNELKGRIKEALSSGNSIDSLKDRIHIPILLLHECNITKQENRFSEQYKESIIQYHKERAQSYFEKQVSQLGSIFDYSKINFHLILFPVPEKEIIVDRFVENVEHYKEQ